ncbi:MAG: hypothetical protein MJ168_10490 [Clostridia bacterium]|nr:hypothetical protein [Clostridia bacterium]
MTKADCLKKSKLFLKMAKCDFALINLIKIIKCILTVALFVNTGAFALTLICGAKKSKL